MQLSGRRWENMTYMLLASDSATTRKLFEKSQCIEQCIMSNMA